ncbi:adenylyl-sulfate kinase [bacterium]|nr:MAG: adenylyl-sulfate kinase [bacterium]
MMDTWVLWFTGLSGSGKSTIADKVSIILSQSRKKVAIFDGDVIRNTIHKGLRFTPEDIKENNRKVALLCLENKGLYDFILVPVISPFHESRAYARNVLSPCFIEIYVKADLSECIKRDVKGLYKDALSGLIDNFIGISPSTPYEEPLDPDICLDTIRQDVDESVSQLLAHLSDIKAYKNSI